MPQKGDIVRVKAYVTAEYDGPAARVKELVRHPVSDGALAPALVLGTTYLVAGTHEDENPETPYTFEDKRYPVWRVTAYDLTGQDQQCNATYTVLEDDIEVITPKLEDHFKTGRNTRPAEVQPGDCFGYKVVATVREHGPGYGASSWVAYRGPTEWTDQKVLDQGEKIGPKTARALFYVFANASEIHYEW